MNIKYLVIIFIYVIIILGCSRDRTIPLVLSCDPAGEMESRYSTSIGVIIDLTCANSSCHDGSDPTISDYRFYSGILPDLENGLVWREVFELNDMPIQGSEGDSNFTQEYYEDLKCWIEIGFPE